MLSADRQDFRVVIPARYGSTRLPGKALLSIAGRSLIHHVWEQAMRSSASEVVIATDDERILAVARGFGAEVIMTSPDHRSGTERLAEVASALHYQATDIIVNCQGDAPLMPADSIDQVAELLAADPAADMATLCVPLHEEREYRNPHVVKTVFDQCGRALYFSRAPIPGRGHDASGPLRAWRHLGLYAYRAAALCRLAAAPPCELEQSEQLEQLRALWLGMNIRIAEARAAHGPDVDTAEDLAAVAALLGKAPGL